MLEVHIQDDGPLRMVVVKGEVDLSTAPGLWKKMQAAFPGVGKLRVRLSEVSYMDSTGVAVLVQSHKHARQSSVDFALLDPSPQVSAVIELARLNDLFIIETTA